MGKCNNINHEACGRSFHQEGHTFIWVLMLRFKKTVDLREGIWRTAIGTISNP